MRVSVIIPCYNVEAYFDECIASLLGQTIGLDSMQIILVDDCSTDRTPEILRSYEKKYPDTILLVFSEENGRQGRARNIGLSYADGEYVLFVDADDKVRSDYLEIITREMEKHNLDLLQFRYIDLRKQTETESAPIPDITVYDFMPPENRRRYVLRNDILRTGCTTLCYRRKLLLAADVRFAEKVAYEEPLFTYPLRYVANRVGVLDAPLYFYRYNEHGTTASYMRKASTIMDHLTVQQAVLNHMQATPHYMMYRNEINLYYLHSFYVEPFYFLHYRGATLPVSLFRHMAAQVRLHIPDFMDNPYLTDPSLKEEVTLIRLIDELKNVADEDASKIIRAIPLS